MITDNIKSSIDIFTLKEQDGVKILYRNNNPQFCPFKPTLILPGQIQGQLQLHREPCGAICPHFVGLDQNNKPDLNCKK